MRIRTLAVQLALLLLVALLAPDAAQAQALRAPDVIFVPTPQEVVDVMLEVAHVTKNDVVYDLGSGDGRIPITAAKRFGARAVGIDRRRGSDRGPQRPAGPRLRRTPH